MWGPHAACPEPPLFHLTEKKLIITFLLKKLNKERRVYDCLCYFLGFFSYLIIYILYSTCQRKSHLFEFYLHHPIIGVVPSCTNCPPNKTPITKRQMHLRRHRLTSVHLSSLNAENIHILTTLIHQCFHANWIGIRMPLTLEKYIFK